jgi:pimeloyl-ACP methyl ester carboxylesterase
MPSWKLVYPQLKLFRYIGIDQHMTKPCQPVLMLHGTLANHRTWEAMAGYFWNYGIDGLYALDMPEVQSGEPLHSTLDQLMQAIHVILDEQHPEAETLILIGHGAGGIVAYRYWQAFEEEARVSFLFSLAAPHNMTTFPLLREEMIRSAVRGGNPEDMRSTQSPPVDFSKIKALQGETSAVLVNIIGNQVEPNFDAVVRGLESSPQDDGIIMQGVGTAFDGIVRGLNLPEAVNWMVPLHPPLSHKDMNKDTRIAHAILSCLRGEYYRVTLKLVAIRLLGEDGGGLCGPIAFEINGSRMPADSVFHGLVNRLYVFEENVPPICTLSYPLDAMSGTIILHLKDLSNQRGRRRRMYTRVHLPLREADHTTHTMQDSEGSDFLWRIDCQRMPVVLEDPTIPPRPRLLSRGI